ncbi:MAG: DUF2070 family protein [Candidatus Nezhaarchaeales archaeon]
MISTEEATKAYSLLFQLPRTRYLILLAIIIVLLPVMISAKPLYTFIAWVCPPLLVTILTYYLNRSNALTWKRCFAVSTAGLLAQVLTYLVLTPLIICLAPNNLTKVLPLASSAMFTLIHLIATQPLTGHRARAPFPALLSFIISSMLYASAYDVDPFTTVAIILISQVTGVSLAYMTLKIIDITASDHEMGGLTLFRAFSDVWLLNDPSSLEAILKRKGEVTRVQVTSLVFRSRRGVEGCFITFDAHPGPFRNVGGSSLPADISKAVELALGGVCLAFHSTATHERDPVSREEASKIIRAAVQASARTSRLAKPLYTQFACSSEIEPHIYCQVLGIPIISIVWRKKRAEDLPHALGVELKNEVKKRGFVDALVIDAHNCHLPTEPLPKLNLNDLRLRAVKVIDEAVKRAVTEGIKAAFGRVSLSCEVEEVGAAGIKLALISVGGSDSVYVLIDANNLDPELHRAFLDKLSGQGLDFAEMYTTDTHSVVGLKAVERGYRAFGEGRKSEDVVSLIYDAVNSLRRQLVEVEVEVGTEEVEVEVIGEQGLISLLKQLRRGLRVVKWALPVACLLGTVLPLLFTVWLLY